jgi:hypothetical protein
MSKLRMVIFADKFVNWLSVVMKRAVDICNVVIIMPWMLRVISDGTVTKFGNR